MAVGISSALLAEIVDRCAAVPKSEVCGLLLGSFHIVTEVRHTHNVAPDPARHFEVDPASLLDAHRRARAGGLAVVGCYHSHPVGPAWPSPRDAAAAGGDAFLWLIVSGDEARLFRAGTIGSIHGRFERDELAVTSLATASSSGQKAPPQRSRGTRH